MERRRQRTKEEINTAFEVNPPTWDLKTFEGCCEYLLFFRNEASDDIPEEILHSYSDPYFRKVRKIWWRGIISVLDLMEKRNILPVEHWNAVQTFRTKYNGDWFWTKEHRTTQEHIDEANALITQIAGS